MQGSGKLVSEVEVARFVLLVFGGFVKLDKLVRDKGFDFSLWQFNFFFKYETSLDALRIFLDGLVYFSDLPMLSVDTGQAGVRLRAWA